MSEHLLEALRLLVREEAPPFVLSALWEYRVTSVNADGTVNGLPSDTRVPALNNVPFSAMASGGVCDPAVGTSFLVEFRDATGTKYGVVGASPIPTTATLDAERTVELAPTASNPLEVGPVPEGKVARVGDSLQVFFPVCLLNGGFSPFSGEFEVLHNYPCSVLTPLPGIVTSGNNRVLA